MDHGHVAVVGSTNMDMITYVAGVPARGETVTGESFALGFGGKGANQAVMARRLGADVSMVNTLGDDVFGDTTMANFENEGIDTAWISRVPGPSGVAPIWVEPDGANRIIVVPGANALMTPEGAISALKGMAEYQVVVGQLEIPQEVTLAAFQQGRKDGAITILNPAPYQELLPDLVAASDWIVPNETEFAGLHPQGLLPESDAIILEVAHALGTNLLVTLGESGVAATLPNGTVLRIPAPTVDALDTTGAGDCFVGTFAAGLAAGLALEVALTLGITCASESVTNQGTQSSYPSPARAEEIMEQVLQSFSAP